jgi:hypothetical protein
VPTVFRERILDCYGLYPIYPGAEIRIRDPAVFRFNYLVPSWKNLRRQIRVI